MIAKGELDEGATGWAQGGIAAVLEDGDRFEAHVEDTMIAGAGLNNRATVEFVVENAPGGDRAAGRARRAVQPRRGRERWHLTREGGHSHRRIVHVADATGWAVQQALEKAAAAHPNITLDPRHGGDRPRHRPPRRATSRPAARSTGVYALQPRDRPGRDVHRPGDDPRHRRRRPRLSLFDRAARRDRRRHRHGLARGLPRLQHGVHAVPPDLPLQSGGQEFPDHRGGARRGRAC